MQHFHVQFPGVGWEFDISNVAFTIGSYSVYWYGLIITAGLLLALLYAWRSAPRYNVNASKLFNCVLVGLVTGIIGARLYYVAFAWEDYASDPISILYIHEGGLAIYGGIIGALLGGFVMAKIQRLKFMPILDITMVGFLIGQGIGRWGNFMNQEAFGAPTDLPWRMLSENTVVNGQVTAVHPCFLYERLWCLLWYGFERRSVEGLRTDSLYLPVQLFGMDIRVSQVLSAFIMVIGLIMLLINIKREDPFYADYRRKKGIVRSKAKHQRAH